MGLVIDSDSVEDALFNLNQNYSDASRSNSLSYQKAQSAVDSAYSQSMMSSYESYLQNQNASNNMNLIDGLRNEANKYNLESLYNAFESSRNTYLSDSTALYQSYLENQGIVGDDLMALAKSYSSAADEYLNYMKQYDYYQDGALNDLGQFFVTSGLATEATDINNEGEEYKYLSFADDSLIRNMMFNTQNELDASGNVIKQKGAFTDTGKAILSTLQSYGTKGNNLSFDAWYRNQKSYDDSINLDVLANMMGMENSYGKSYTIKELIATSEEVKQAVVSEFDGMIYNQSKGIDYRIDQSQAYQSLVNGSADVNESTITTIQDDLAKTYSVIEEELTKYGYTMEEFCEYAGISQDDIKRDTEGNITGSNKANSLSEYYDEYESVDKFNNHYEAAVGLGGLMMGAGAIVGAIPAVGWIVGGALLLFGAAITAVGSVGISVATKSNDYYRDKMKEEMKSLGVYQNSIMSKYKEFMMSGGSK